MGDAKEATTRELCRQAKKHYLEIASEAMHTNSLIPRVLDEYPTLTADNKRLRAVLEPFALLGEKLIEFGVDDKPIWLIELNGLNYSVRATSLKQAAAAMAQEASDE